MNLKHIIATAAIAIVGIAASAQTYDQLWITGSAVPGGLQQLTAFPNSQFKFAGTLTEGELKIINTEGATDGTVYLMPRYLDSNIVSYGLPYTTTTDATDDGWVVLFDDDRYKFTVDMSARTVTGELLSPWLELYIAGGCVECGWDAGLAPALVQDDSDPYVWTWTGELKNRPENEEPNRFKILGQNDWSPKSLHPYTQDEPATTSTQLMINGDDNKWAIAADGYYKVTVNIFLQTFACEYLGTEAPTAISSPTDDALTPTLKLTGNTIVATGAADMTVEVVSAAGRHVARRSGPNVSLNINNKGIYIVKATDSHGTTVRKVVI